jgi:hypothetical protein
MEAQAAKDITERANNRVPGDLPKTIEHQPIANGKGSE